MMFASFLLICAGQIFSVENKCPTAFVVENKIPAITANDAPTPYVEITRVFNLLPAPQIAFIEIGCGAFAPWCFAAVEKWGCHAVGIEIDPTLASAARERVKVAGLGHLITIITGDATTTEIQGDAAGMYLYKSTLEKLRPRLEKLSWSVSYLHRPPGLSVVQNGDSWIYTQPVQKAAAVRQPTAVWNGLLYTAPECDKQNCGMCAEIRRQLAAQQQPPKVESPKLAALPVKLGHWENRDQTVCTFNSRGRRTGCSVQSIPVWVEDKK